MPGLTIYVLTTGQKEIKIENVTDIEFDHTEVFKDGVITDTVQVISNTASSATPTTTALVGAGPYDWGGMTTTPTTGLVTLTNPQSIIYFTIDGFTPATKKLFFFAKFVQGLYTSPQTGV